MNDEFFFFVFLVSLSFITFVDSVLLLCLSNSFLSRSCPLDISYYIPCPLVDFIWIFTVCARFPHYFGEKFLVLCIHHQVRRIRVLVVVFRMGGLIWESVVVGERRGVTFRRCVEHIMFDNVETLRSCICIPLLFVGGLTFFCFL